MALKDKFLNGRGLYSLMDKIKNFVKPNQQTSGGESNLTSLEVNGTNYVVPQGTSVTANPSPAGSTALTGIEIDSTKYVIPTELPSVTSVDEGKFLRVNSNGVWIADTVPSAENQSF